MGAPSETARLLAAISHDLRQPLHAVGLYAEALRAQPLDDAALTLVDRLRTGVEVLEDLFSQLLDYSRITANEIEAQLQPVPMQAVYDRLLSHVQPQAFEQGLIMHFWGGHHWVWADPVLLERTLRNLICNALRHTSDGGVLVTCRPQRGGFRVQVIDTGCGISPQHLPLVFQEFFQAQPSPAGPAGTRHGLGLGLTIVERLCQQMGTSVSVRSQLNRGSCFEFGLPRPPQPARPPCPWSRPVESVPRHWTLTHRRVWVLDDDEAVRDGLAELLGSWGAAVRSFSSSGEVLNAALATTDRPHVLLCDHQLREAMSGLDLLGRLQRLWHAGPVVRLALITGTTDPWVEQQAQELGLPLWLKPVPPSRLRAALAAWCPAPSPQAEGNKR